MATPAVEELVDEGVGSGLIDEGVAPILPQPTKEPLPPEVAFERAGKVWDAAIENEVPLPVAQEWFYDAQIAASDPDDFAAPVPDNRTGFSENFKYEWTFRKGITKLPIAGGIIGLGRAPAMAMLANRLLDPEFDYDAYNRRMNKMQKYSLSAAPYFDTSRQRDQEIIAQAYKDFEFETRPKTMGGKVAAGVSRLPTWMIEFAATGGLASLGDDAARIAGEKLLGRYAQTTAGKIGIRSAGLVTGAVVRTSTGLLPRVGEKAAERQILITLGLTGKEGWATSLARAWGDVAIESLTEETGGIITKGLSAGLAKLPFGGKFIASLQDDWIKLTGGTSDDFVSRMLTKGGYSNIVGEVGEERLATLLREATGVSERTGNPFQRIWAGMKEDFEPENLGAEIITLLAPASMKRGMAVGVSLTRGASVPSESTQLDQAVGVGPIQFDTPEEAQGYAAKATQVAERIGRDVTITVEPADNTVTVEEVVEEEAKVAKPGVKPAEAKAEGVVVFTPEGEVRALLQSGQAGGVTYKSIFRPTGSTRAVVEIMGQRFTIDDSSRLAKGAGMRLVGGRGKSQLGKLKTQKQVNEFFDQYPKLTAADFALTQQAQPPTEAEAKEQVAVKVQKLISKAAKDIRAAKQPRRLIEQEKTAELGKRVKRSAKAAADMAGEQRLNAALGQLAGPLTDYKRPDFTPLKETWSKADIDAVHDDIWVNPHSPDHFDMLGTAKAWSKVTEGFVPTRGEILLLEKQFGKEIVRSLLKKRPFGDRAWDTAADISNFMRTMLAGGDISVAGRQLRVLGQAYPLEWGKAVTKGLGAYKSEKLAVLMRQEYTASEFHREAKRYVQFFDPAGTVTTPPSERPEWYMSHYPEQVPILGHLIRMGNRNYVETVNMFTQDVWDKLRAQDIRNGVEPTEQDLLLRGKWLMSMTGRPEIGGVVGRRLAPIASGFFFAPRFAVSRFSSPMYLRHLAKGDPVAREVGRNTAIAFASFIGTNIAALSLLKLALGDDVEIELDLRSPDWGKARIGNTRIDLWAGHQQAARFLVQMALGEYKTQAGKIKETSRLETVGRFIRGKENPLVSLISDLYKGKTYEGDRPFSPPEGEMGKILDELKVPELIQGVGKEAYNRMLFMWVQDFLDATANDGWLMGFTAGTLSFFGFNTASYEDTPFTKIANFKNNIAQTEHGRDWNDLSSSQQVRLSRINKQVLSEMKLQARIEGVRRDDYDYVARLIEDEKKAGKKVYKKLTPTNRKMLDQAGISLGLSRKIGDWEINDERYTQYQEITAGLLDEKLTRLFNMEGWSALTKSKQVAKIELAVQIAKDKAKSQVRREAKKAQ